MTEIDFAAFDSDNHYYEAPDAFTRHLEPQFAKRGMQWAQVNGKTRLLVGGRINRFIPNPTWDPVSKPGALDEYFRGRNPKGEDTSVLFGELDRLADPLLSGIYGGDAAQGARGEPCWVEGRVTDTAGNPLAGAEIEVWEADEDGFYDVQYSDARTAGRAARLAASCCSLRAPTMTVATASGRSSRPPTRSQVTARSASYSPQPPAARCARPIFTSWSPHPATTGSSRTSSLPAVRTSTTMQCSASRSP